MTPLAFASWKRLGVLSARETRKPKRRGPMWRAGYWLELSAGLD